MQNTMSQLARSGRPSTIFAPSLASGSALARALFHRAFHLPYVGLISFLLLLYLIGLITTNVLGRKLIGWGARNLLPLTC